MRKPLIYLFVFLISAGFSQEDEYLIKGILLEKLTRFIDWPEDSQRDNPSEKFIIGIIGETPLKNKLDKIYAMVPIKGKSVEIKYFNETIELTPCHLLYLAKTSEEKLTAILSYTWNKPILTISDTQGYCQKGVVVNFYRTDNNIRFEINRRAAHNARLKIAPILLNISKIIDPME